jgi:hypothetical protein
VPRLIWNGTGLKFVEHYTIPPRGLIVLEPGAGPSNEVTEAQLEAMRPHIKLELDAGTIGILNPSTEVIVPGVVESTGETPEPTSEPQQLPQSSAAPAAEPAASPSLNENPETAAAAPVETAEAAPQEGAPAVGPETGPGKE